MLRGWPEWFTGNLKLKKHKLLRTVGAAASDSPVSPQFSGSGALGRAGRWGGQDRGEGDGDHEEDQAGGWTVLAGPWAPWYLLPGGLAYNSWILSHPVKPQALEVSRREEKASGSLALGFWDPE